MLVIDVEASGLDPRKHAILSIGGVELENPSNQFYGSARVWDGAEIDDEALAVNGFSREEVTDPSKQSQEVLLRAFLGWAKRADDCTMAGHNFAMDLYYLKFSAEREGLNFFPPKRTLDTHSLVYMHMTARGLEPPMENNRTAIDSDFVCDYVGIPHEESPHNALAGAKFEAEAISRLLYDQKLLDEYTEYDIPWM